MTSLRQRLIEVTLEWQYQFGVAPAITSALSEFDAAILIGMSESEYSAHMQNQTAVQKGYDFIFNGTRYQVKANRPSGRPGSTVTLVPKVKNYDWDILIWILYNKDYKIQEAWSWTIADYKKSFHEITRLSPKHYRDGKCLHHTPAAIRSQPL